MYVTPNSVFTEKELQDELKKKRIKEAQEKPNMAKSYIEQHVR